MVNRNKKSCSGNLFYMIPGNTFDELWASLNQKWKSWNIPPVPLSFTPSKLANSCCVSISTILILFFPCEHQASSFGFEGMFSIQKRVHIMIMAKNRILVTTDDLFSELLCVSPCNWFDFSSTRLGEPSFSLFFGSIFLVFCWLSCFEIWEWINQFLFRYSWVIN